MADEQAALLSLASAGIAWMFYAYHFSRPGEPFQYEAENLRRVVVLAAVVAPAPAADAVGVGACTITGTITFKPAGAGSEIGLWDISPAQIACRGQFNTYELMLKQAGFTGKGSYTTLPSGEGGCLRELGTGVVDHDSDAGNGHLGIGPTGSQGLVRSLTQELIDRLMPYGETVTALVLSSPVTHRVLGEPQVASRLRIFRGAALPGGLHAAAVELHQAAHHRQADPEPALGMVERAAFLLADLVDLVPGGPRGLRQRPRPQVLYEAAHGLRGVASDDDEAWLRGECERLQTPYIARRAPVPGQAAGYPTSPAGSLF